MNTAITRTLWAVIVVTASALPAYTLFMPKPAAAVGTAADAMCIASWDYGCPCGVVCHKGGPPGGLNCPCSDVTSGFTTQGKCVSALKCLATSAQGQNGGMGDLKQALDMAKSILDMMKGKGGGGGGGDSGAGAGTGATNPTLGGCSQYYNVTTPSSDPCAVYIPPVSSALASTSGSAATDLISSLLNGAYGTGSNTSGSTNTSNTQVAATTTTTTAAATQQTTTGTAPAGVMAQAPGVSGDIQYSSSTVTVLVNNVDQKSGTQVAGFYGTDAGGQPTGVISNMCQSRPWSSNFLSFIIPSSFFDSLCELRGYKVGTPVVAAPATHTVSKPKVVKTIATTTPDVPAGPYVEPQADIWAVPAGVPLGARTTVFWNAKGVTSCTETSPDGSFSQNSLSGGAATVPLSGPTTYTISCLTPKGDHITNYVTVNLATN